MALNYKKNTQVENQTSTPTTDFELVTISKWRYKNYVKDEMVYLNTQSGTIIYKCVADHNARIYTNSGGKFRDIVGGVTYWIPISGHFDQSPYPQSAELDGSVYTLVLTNGTKISTDLSSIDTYLNEVDYDNGTLTFKDTNGQVLDTVDISSVTGGTEDTFVQSGYTSNTNLVLVKNNGDILPPIDLSSLVGDDVYLESGFYRDEKINLVMNNGNVIEIDVNPLLLDTNTFVESGQINANKLELNLNNGTTVFIDISSISQDIYATSGSYNKSTQRLTISRNNGSSFSINLGDLATEDDVIVDAYITGSDLIFEYFDGDTISVDITSLLENYYVNSGNYDGQNLTLTRTDGGTVVIPMPIDEIISGATGNTFVTGGTVVGDDLVLDFNNGSSITIDCTDFTEDKYISSAFLQGSSLKIVRNDGTVFSVPLDGVNIDNFTELLDTPNDYTGHGGKLVAVNDAETGLEFLSLSGGSITTNNYLTISDPAFSSGASSTYEFNVTNIHLDAQEIVILINLTGATASTDHYLVNLPATPLGIHESKKLTVICKEFNMTNTDYGLFINTPWVSGGTVNRILAKDTDTSVTGATVSDGYYYPLEKLEVIEFFFDGTDWIGINNMKNQYVAINAVDFFNNDPDGTNANYINR